MIRDFSFSIRPTISRSSIVAQHYSPPQLDCSSTGFLFARHLGMVSQPRGAPQGFVASLSGLPAYSSQRTDLGAEVLHSERRGQNLWILESATGGSTSSSADCTRAPTLRSHSSAIVHVRFETLNFIPIRRQHVRARENAVNLAVRSAKPR